ncbi:MAG: SpaA isopeptide-forming pilin-related protein [bacterium]|nr:SpaA isopeptide-forming pilin-related protein [bacterium]
MKKNFIYLTTLLMFFVGMTNVFAVDIQNNGIVSGFDINTNPYSCSGVNKGVYNLTDENNKLYYSALCSVDFPCINGNDACGDIIPYTETNTCYITCDNYTNIANIGTNQHNIWNKISSYPTISCSNGYADTEQYNAAMQKLIHEDGVCDADDLFYALYEYSNGSSKVVTVRPPQQCDPTISVTKICKGFSSGKFTVKIGNETKEVSCGETSEAVIVTADTPIAIEELNNSGYLVYISDNVENGTIIPKQGEKQEITIINALAKVNLTKLNAVNNAPMSGMKFSLEKKVNGEWVKATKIDGTQFEDLTTDNNGKLTFAGVPIGEYRLVEVENATGNYVAADPYEFKINKDTVDQEYSENITLKNNPFEIKFIKVDENGNTLGDSVFMIDKQDEKGVFHTVSEPTIDKNGSMIHLEKNGVYKITEQQSPLGYDVLGAPFIIKIANGKVTIEEGDLNYISVLEENGIYTLKVINDKSKVKIYKRDSATASILAGAKMVLTKKDGTLVANFTTEKDSSFAIELLPGSYILYEESAPKNYEKTNVKFEFVVKEDGTIEAITINSSFEIDGMNINVYNVKPTTVPNTGVALNIIIIIGGIALIGFGGYLVYSNVKKRKNI